MLTKGAVSAGLVGVALTQGLQLSGIFQYAVLRTAVLGAWQMRTICPTLCHEALAPKSMVRRAKRAGFDVVLDSRVAFRLACQLP